MTREKADMDFSRVFIRLTVLAAMFLPAVALAGPNPCTASVAEAERTFGIPSGLLQAMAIHESGVKGQPYPWALNLSGRVVYAGNLDAAQKLLDERKAQGRKNLYAGCMQLSVFYHANAFGSLRDLLQPKRNVAYAAKYLATHYEDYGDWQAAVRRYQGGKPRQSAAYFCKVLRVLRDIRPATARELDDGRCGPLPSIAETPAVVPASTPLPRGDIRETS
jgi:hypothetical protein